MPLLAVTFDWAECKIDSGTKSSGYLRNWRTTFDVEDQVRESIDEDDDDVDEAGKDGYSLFDGETFEDVVAKEVGHFCT